MRLLVISGAYPPMASGEAANARALVRRLAARGVEVHVLTGKGARSGPDPEGGEDPVGAEGADAGEASGRRPSEGCASISAVMRGWSWRHLPRFVLELRRIRPDAVLLLHLGGMYERHPMITFAPSVAKRVLGDVPFVTRFENPLSPVQPEQFGPHVRLLRRFAARAAGGAHYASGTLLARSDRVIALCSYHLDLLAEQDPSVAERARVVPPPANVRVADDPDGDRRRRGRASLGVPEDRFLLGYLGYVYENKGVDVLLEALERALGSGGGFHLAVLGGAVEAAGMDPGYLDRMKARARELGVAERVTWTGAFSPDDPRLPDWIHAADLFVLPFRNGTHLNNSSVSSLATYGRPLVLTRAEHSDDDFVHGENAVLVRPSDPEGLAEALRMLADDPARLHRLGAGARRLAAERFSWARCLEDTLEALSPGRREVAA